jgi:kinesin family protein 22
VVDNSNLFLVVKEMLDESFLGKNGTIFAYGQTGSGKSYTINGVEDHPGLIPQSLQYLMSQKTAQTSISVSFIEIYNDRITDLLSERNLDIREQNRQIVLHGQSLIPISTMQEFENHQQRALERRSTASTNLNSKSSRSHYIVQLAIESIAGNKIRKSKLHFIDLAGSEDNKRTGNQGARMKESGAINKSLFVLGQVVEALNKNAPRVPFRDSKITRVLQDSLGGTAIGIMIACCSPDRDHFLDTYNTLMFAVKSSNVKNEIIINEHVKPQQEPTRKRILETWKLQNKRAKSFEGLPKSGQ